MGRVLFALVAVCLLVTGARADVIQLNDGSRIVGSVESVQNGQLSVRTQFGVVSIPAFQVTALDTDDFVVVHDDAGGSSLSSFTTERGVQEMVTADGARSEVDITTISGAFVQAQPATPVEPVPQDTPPAPTPEDPEPAPEPEDDGEDEYTGPTWEYRLEFGINGQTGNSEEFTFRGIAEAKRTSDVDRLRLFVRGDFSQTNGEQSDNEVRAGWRYEYDISDRWYLYTSGFVEHDEVEDLNLRVNAVGGLGYFVFKEDDLELTLYGGPGYEYEDFNDGTTNSKAILNLGYGFRWDINESVRFTSGLDYYPSLEDFANDYRLEAENAIEIPISDDERLKIRGGIRNEYTSLPSAGAERLETRYFLNLVYAWN